MEKKFLSLVVSLLLVISLLPAAFAQVGGGVDIEIDPEAEAPHIWLCDSSVIIEGNSNVGRATPSGSDLVNRENNYAFEGEGMAWNLLVEDSNGIENIEDVTVTVGDTFGDGNDVVADCQQSPAPAPGTPLPESCNAVDGEEDFDEFNIDTMDFYDCTFTVPSASQMEEEVFVSLEVVDSDGLAEITDEAEFWFLNPEVGVSLSESSIEFEDASPGTFTYSDTFTVMNDAEEGSGVQLDMFVSGSDFFSSDGGACPDSNVLRLYDEGTLVDEHPSGIFYTATSGAYGTDDEVGEAIVDRTGASAPTDRFVDDEGYVNIGYATIFERPGFYDGFEIIKTADDVDRLDTTAFSPGNFLSPGADIALTFLLALPEPCTGSFDDGQILFWGEPV